MNFSSREQEQHDFQIAPMIDIVFLLLIFFIVSYAMTQIEYEMGIELPTAKAAGEQTSRRDQVVINIGPDGGIVVNRQSMSPAELHRRLEKVVTFLEEEEGRSVALSVVIRADEVTQHRHVMRVMDICRRAGVRDILFRARKEEGTDGSGT